MRTIFDSQNVLSLYFDDVKAGWEKWFLLSSDRHHDGMKCNRVLEKAHLDKALSLDATILDFGDIFDAMQGRYDPRRSFDDVRPEFKTNKYLDAIVEDAAKFYKPYAKNFALIARGNHDSTILKNNGVDIVSNLVHRLNTEGGGNIQAGGYGGWVRLMFTIYKTQRISKRLKYYHGSGGDAPVTRGVIQTARQGLYLPDADIVVNGHSHNAYHVPIARERLSDGGVIGRDLQHHIRTATYQDDYGDGSGGWHIERGGPPKPMGAVWMKLSFSKANGVDITFTQDIE